MDILDKATKALEHKLINNLINIWKKIKPSKSYWTSVAILIPFILSQAKSYEIGKVIVLYADKQIHENSFPLIWGIISFIASELYDDAKWELVLLGIVILLIITYAFGRKDNIPNDIVTMSKKDIFELAEPEFLLKYFGVDYEEVLKNPQTYQNLKQKLQDKTKTFDDLLKEKEELEQKIKNITLHSEIKEDIDKAFFELRFEDALSLLNNFIDNNKQIERDIAKAHYLKGIALFQQSQYKEAEEEFEIAYVIDKENLIILDDYAGILSTNGNYKKSISLYKNSVESNIKRNNFRNVAHSLMNIGTTLSLDGHFNEAIEAYTKAIEAIKLQDIKDYSLISNIYNYKAMAYYKLGNIQEAEKLLHISLQILVDNDCRDLQSLSRIYNNMAGILSLYNTEKAIEITKKSLEIKKEVLDENNPEIANTYNNLGTLEQDRNQPNQAIKYYTEALKIYTFSLGEEHFRVVNVYMNLGNAWDEKGNYDKAMIFFNKALNIAETIKLTDKDDQLVANILHNIGVCEELNKNYDEAIDYYNKALLIYKKPEQNILELSEIYVCLGNAYGLKDEYKKAIKYYEESLKIKREHLNDKDESIKDIENRILKGKENLRNIF